MVSFSTHGEMSERFKEPVLKTGDGATHRGFESHSLRQNESTPFGCAFFAITDSLSCVQDLQKSIPPKGNCPNPIFVNWRFVQSCPGKLD